MTHVDPMGEGVISGVYAHQLGVPLRGVTVWGVISGWLFSAHPLNPVSEITYTVSSGTLNSTIHTYIPYHTIPYIPYIQTNT